MKHALVTGVTGMDGSILADYLIEKGYKVFGFTRRSASPNFWRIQHLLKHPNFQLIEGDLTDQDTIYRAIETSTPSLVFNLGAQSFVPYSWSAPVHTFQITGMAPISILEAIRKTDKKIKFYQASSSEMFGKVLETPQSEKTPFYPRSPYAVAKAAAHYATVNYHESFGIHATSGILFNHEHERRGSQFVSRKITRGVANFFANKTKNQLREPLALGNLEAKRDWGYAEDYVKAMYKIINHPTPETFVVATGITRTVREFCEAAVAAAVKKLNLPPQKITWKGSGESEVGYFDNEPLIVISKEFYRPAEVDLLLGDPSKAKEKLGWIAETPFTTMVEKMFNFDYENYLMDKTNLD